MASRALGREPVSGVQAAGGGRLAGQRNVAGRRVQAVAHGGQSEGFQKRGETHAGEEGRAWRKGCCRARGAVSHLLGR